MSDGVQVKLEGIDELLIKFKTVSDQVQGKVTQFALRKASNVMRDRVKASLRRYDDPTTREAIFENVIAKNQPRRFRQAGELQTRLGILGGARSRAENEQHPGGDTFYWRFLEFGKEKSPGKRPITSAVIASQGEFYSTFSREMEKAIDRAIKRAEKAARAS